MKSPLDASELLRREEFVYANCFLVRNSTFVSYRLDQDRVVIDRVAYFDPSNLTSVFNNFSCQIGDSTFAGGEAAGHGSGGYFYRKTGDRVAWVVMSIDSGPFVDVDVFGGDVVFLSAEGTRWIVRNGDVTSIYIQR